MVQPTARSPGAVAGTLMVPCDTARSKKRPSTESFWPLTQSRASPDPWRRMASSEPAAQDPSKTTTALLVAVMLGLALGRSLTTPPWLPSVEYEPVVARGGEAHPGRPAGALEPDRDIVAGAEGDPDVALAVLRRAGDDGHPEGLVRGDVDLGVGPADPAGAGAQGDDLVVRAADRAAVARGHDDGASGLVVPHERREPLLQRARAVVGAVVAAQAEVDDHRDGRAGGAGADGGHARGAGAAFRESHRRGPLEDEAGAVEDVGVEEPAVQRGRREDQRRLGRHPHVARRAGQRDAPVAGGDRGDVGAVPVGVVRAGPRRR